MATNTHPTTTVTPEDEADEAPPLGMNHVTVVPTNFKPPVEE